MQGGRDTKINRNSAFHQGAHISMGEIDVEKNIYKIVCINVAISIQIVVKGIKKNPRETKYLTPYVYATEKKEQKKSVRMLEGKLLIV